MKTIIMFRGSVTDAILADAVRHGLVCPDDKVVVVSFVGDRLRQPGDVMVEDVISAQVGSTVIIGNGGQSAQSMPVVESFARQAGAEDAWAGEDCGKDVCEDRSWRWQIVDVRREEVVFLAGDVSLDVEKDEDDSVFDDAS